MSGSRETASTPPAATGLAYAAAVWSLVHAALGAHWALGGTTGLDALGTDLHRAAQTSDPTFLAVAAISAALALIAALIGLSVARGWLAPSTRVTAAAVLGGLLILYGGGSLIQLALVEAGVIEVAADGGPAAWRLLLWQPLFLTSGVILILVAWFARPQPEAPLDTGSINRRIDDIARRGEGDRVEER